MKIVIAPDSFKGTWTAQQAAAAMAAGVRDALPAADIQLLPMADGGDGTGEVLARPLGGEWVELAAPGPLGEQRSARYLRLPRFGAALIEVAAAAGLTLLPPGFRDPAYTTSRGVGVLIRHAIAGGAERIWVALGGSACVDGGAGMAEELGIRFWDARARRIRAGRPNLPLPLFLERLRRCDFQRRPPIDGIEVVGLADVDNPLLGARGAVAIYGPQKGVDARQQPRFERGLERWVEAVEGCRRRDDRSSYQAMLRQRGVRSGAGATLAELPGAGAAGGLGYALMAFLRARLVPGGDLVAHCIGLPAACRGADLVLTGEGRLDAQSFMNKSIDVVARTAAPVSVLAVVGSIAPELRESEWRTRLAAVAALPAHSVRGDIALLRHRTTQLLHEFALLPRCCP
jgi:glycerate kinase